MALSPELADYQLLKQFPGKTLEELDTIDWLRLRRANEVGRVIDLEQRRKLWLEEKLSDDTFTAQDWRDIAINDELAGDDGD